MKPCRDIMPNEVVENEHFLSQLSKLCQFLEETNAIVQKNFFSKLLHHKVGVVGNVVRKNGTIISC